MRFKFARDWRVTPLPVCLVGIGGAHAADYAPKYIEDAGRICVERFEDNGSRNIFPVDVFIDDRLAIRVLGGEAACAYVRPGAHVVHLEWRWLYQAVRGRSLKPIKMEMKQTGIAALEICTAENGQEVPPWLVRNAGDDRGRPCAN